jgi:hypothetical protein
MLRSNNTRTLPGTVHTFAAVPPVSVITASAEHIGPDG